MKDKMGKTKLSYLIITLLVSLFTAATFDARASLVDDLVKKHKLDPKNNPKDQCDLMHWLDDSIVAHADSKPDNGSLCDKSGVCSRSVNFYNFNEKTQTWKKDDYSHAILYTKNSYQILGIVGSSLDGYDEEKYDYNSYKNSRPNFLSKTYVVSDIRNHKEFKKALLQGDKIFVKDFNDGILRMSDSKATPKTDTSYLAIHGCYVSDFKIIDSDNKIYQSQHHK